MLHIITKSPFADNTFETCLRLALPGSEVLLIQDGVLAAMKKTALQPLLLAALKKHAIYALLPDLQARGILDHLHEKIVTVDYDGFVDLVVKHPHVQTWL